MFGLHRFYVYTAFGYNFKPGFNVYHKTDIDLVIVISHDIYKHVDACTCTWCRRMQCSQTYLSCSIIDRGLYKKYLTSTSNWYDIRLLEISKLSTRDHPSFGGVYSDCICPRFIFFYSKDLFRVMSFTRKKSVMRVFIM